MLNKILFTFFIFLSVLYRIQGQDCSLSISGNVIDEGTDLPLEFVNIYIQELGTGTTTDGEGYFRMDSICEGHYHLIFSHIGCEAKKLHLDLFRDTIIRYELSHTSTSLGTVVVEGVKDDFNNQASVSINRQTIEDNINENLSGLLENESGVHLIKNGSGISKPVVQGLFGNRLTILNNGIVQSGQQWGNDHSPEIDPFSSDKITVLKGVSAIEYSGGNLGSVILVEPKRIPKEPHLHGHVNYGFTTNGRGHNLNARLGQSTPSIAWRVNGTLKKFGDLKSANYFLNNTGVEEANLSLQLEKTVNENIFLDFYASTFNTRLGVLRGSHIGNLTDLEQALVRDVPFFTENEFSYAIDAPKQQVSHHLAKFKAKYVVNENQILEGVVALQINDRKEFDIRRGDRSDIPALSLLQFSLNTEAKYTQYFDNDWKWKIGSQNILTDNTNNPETDILPLIPDYFSWKSGVFNTLSKKHNNTQFDLGFRYDVEFQNVATFSRSLPREVIRYNRIFQTIGGLLSIKQDLTEAQSIAFNTGYTVRNPAINELYSSGLHQGVSGIEEGDVDLKSEKAFKNTLTYKWQPNTNFTLNILAYHQHFRGYIFLNPQDEVRLTIRGAFPVFRYEQTNANIYGVDLSTQFTLSKSLFGQLNYSYLKGEDTTDNLPLVFMPPNSFFGSLTYRVSKAVKLSNKASIEDSEMELSNRYVFEQENIFESQDFVDPPSAYNLVGVKVSTNIIFPRYKFRFYIKADNVFNIQYRDYLNRQRYFADDVGISVTAGLNFKF